MTTKCEEHETLCDSVKKMEGNTLQIAISASDTARAVEKIMTNHLPHIQASLTDVSNDIVWLKKLLKWIVELVAVVLAIVGIGVALIGILQVME
jgi:hypothetical protein